MSGPAEELEALRAEVRGLRARARRLELLAQVGDIIHSTLEPQDALRLIVREAVRLTRAGSGSVALVNPNTGLLEIEAASGLPPHAAGFRVRLGEGITGWVAQHGRPARVGDVRRDRRYRMLRPDVTSELAVPLAVGDEVRGALNVDSDRPDAFTEADQDVLTALARQAERVIRHTWLYEQARLKARLLAALVSSARQINTALGLDDLLRLVTREARDLLRARLATVLLLDAAGGALELRAHHGAADGLLGRTRLPLEDSLYAGVLRRRRPLQVEDVRASSLYLGTEAARRAGLASLLSVPLSSGRRGRGVLNVYTGQPHSFSNEEIAALSALADLAVIAMERAELFERTAAAEEQLRQNERLGALGLLAAEVAHEIRNPLTVMKLLYHSLDLQFPPGDPRAEDARLMGVKMEHLNRIVEQVLDFARSSEPRREAVALDEVLGNLRLLVRHKLRQQGVALELRLPPGLPAARADAVQLEQACLNLLLNAAEAMPAGGRLVIRAGRLRRPDGTGGVRLAFHDTGAGMTPEQARRAFTGLLGTTKPHGTGLGLALVRRFVETHQGTVRLRSRPGRGTSIVLTLPAAEGAEAGSAGS